MIPNSIMAFFLFTGMFPTQVAKTQHIHKRKASFWEVAGSGRHFELH